MIVRLTGPFLLCFAQLPTYRNKLASAIVPFDLDSGAKMTIKHFRRTKFYGKSPRPLAKWPIKPTARCYKALHKKQANENSET